jgi:hypothetical protein
VADKEPSLGLVRDTVAHVPHDPRWATEFGVEAVMYVVSARRG